MMVLSSSSSDHALDLSRAASSVTTVDQPRQQSPGPAQEGGLKKGTVRKSGRSRLVPRKQRQQQVQARAGVEAEPAAASIPQLLPVQVRPRELLVSVPQPQAAHPQKMEDLDAFSCQSSIEWRKRTMLELFGDDTLPDQDDVEPGSEGCHTSASFTSPGESDLEPRPCLPRERGEDGHGKGLVHGDANVRAHAQAHACHACSSGSGTPLQQELTSCSDSDHRYPLSSSHRSSSNSASPSSQPSRQQQRSVSHLRVQLPQLAVKKPRSDTCKKPSQYNVSPHSVLGAADFDTSGMDGLSLLLEVARGVDSECESRGTGAGSASGSGMGSVAHSVHSPASPQPSQHSASTTATLQSRAKADLDGVSATTHKHSTPKKRADGNTPAPTSARRPSPAVHPPAGLKDSQCGAHGTAVGHKRKNSGSPRITKDVSSGKEWRAVAAKDEPELDEDCCADTSGPGLMPWNRMKAAKGLGSRRYRLLSSMLC